MHTGDQTNLLHPVARQALDDDVVVGGGSGHHDAEFAFGDDVAAVQVGAVREAGGESAHRGNRVVTDDGANLDLEVTTLMKVTEPGHPPAWKKGTGPVDREKRGGFR